MTVELSPEGRARLDQHLDGVEAALMKTGRSREQRRAVVDDLETQILDMLGQRGEAADVGAVEEVLSRLDPVEAYGAGDGMAAERVTLPQVVNLPEVSRPLKRRRDVKSAVVICLILCGTLLLTLPVLADQLQAQRVATLFAQRADLNNINFSVGGMSDESRRMLWLTGTVAICAGVGGGFMAFALDRKTRKE